MEATTPNLRFKEARQRLGLLEHEVTERSGVSHADVWEIEGLEGDLTCCYTPKELQKLCRVLTIRPIELFADNFSESPISPQELVQLIHAECHSRNLTLEQFEDIVEWRLVGAIEPPEKLLEEMTLDGLRWLCRELHIDWRRVLLTL